jgi:hypothetical protein
MVNGFGMPKWMMRAAIDHDDGTIYATSVAVEVSEQEALFGALFDGVKLASYEGHSYFPTDWLRREFPCENGVLASIEGRIRREMEADPLRKGEQRKGSVAGVLK